MVPGCHARLSGEAELWTAAVYRANPGLGCGWWATMLFTWPAWSPRSTAS